MPGPYFLGSVFKMLQALCFPSGLCKSESSVGKERTSRQNALKEVSLSDSMWYAFKKSSAADLLASTTQRGSMPSMILNSSEGERLPLSPSTNTTAMWLASYPRKRAVFSRASWVAADVHLSQTTRKSPSLKPLTESENCLAMNCRE